MAQLGTFDPSQVQDEERELLPAGTYTAQIIESDLVATKNGAGQMLKLTFEIVDGPCAKRRVWENLNIQHTNQQAQEIAQRSLKRICSAVGHQGVLTDSEHLHFKPMRIRVAIEEDKSGQYGPQNRVKGFEPLNGAATPAPSSGYTPPQQQEQPRQAAGGGRPWGNR
jgi:hypothetical protein